MVLDAAGGTLGVGTSLRGKERGGHGAGRRVLVLARTGQGLRLTLGLVGAVLKFMVATGAVAYRFRSILCAGQQWQLAPETSLTTTGEHIARRHSDAVEGASHAAMRSCRVPHPRTSISSHSISQMHVGPVRKDANRAANPSKLPYSY